jgi:hypothetical protein
MLLLMIGGEANLHSCYVEDKVPLRIHIFLWLLANNKTLTRDNIEKEEMWRIKHVCFVLILSRLNTSSTNVV